MFGSKEYTFVALCAADTNENQPILAPTSNIMDSSPCALFVSNI